MKQCGLNMSEEVYEMVKELAHKERSTVAGTIRKILEEKLRDIAVAECYPGPETRKIINEGFPGVRKVGRPLT